MSATLRHGASSSKDALAYVAIAFALSWLAWMPMIKFHAGEALLNCGVAGPAIAAMVLSYRRHPDSSNSLIVPLAWFLALVVPCWTVLSFHYTWPGNPLAFRLNPVLIGPAILPAWILSGGLTKDAGVRALRRRLVHTPNRWTFLALVSFPAFQLIPAAVAHAFGARLVWPSARGTIPVLVAKAAVSLAFNILFVGIQEEPGWRGFLLDRLQGRFSPLEATLLVWLPWCLWHGPLDYYRPVPFTLTTWLLLRVVTLIPLAIIMTWFYNRSGRSIQATVMFHAAMNTFPLVLPYFRPAMALLFVWAAYVVIAERMWRFAPHVTEQG